MRTFLPMVLVVCLVTGAARSVPAAPTYGATDLGMPTDAVAVYGYAVNASGQVAGFFVHSTLGDRAFRWTSGTFEDLGTLGGGRARAFGINASGDVVGTARTLDGRDHAFLYHAGTMIDVAPASDESEALGINAAGDVVGHARTGATTHAFSYSGGVLMDLGTLGGSKSGATAINDGGQIVGDAYTTGDASSHAFFYGGSMTDLGTLGSGFSKAWSLNGSGVVVGEATAATGFAHPFVDVGGVMTDIGTLGGGIGAAYGVNEAGVVVGFAMAPTSPGVETARPFLYRSGAMENLNDLIPADPPVELFHALGINDSGAIVANGRIAGGTDRAFVVAPLCGNGVIDDGEGCDAGAANGEPGGCCSSACTAMPIASSCLGGVCDSVGVCVDGATSAARLACGSIASETCDDGAARGSKVRIAAGLAAWKWKNASSAVALADFGMPTTGTGYVFCVYDGLGLVLAARVPGGGTCGTRPCWRPLGTKGFAYGDKTEAVDGVKKLKLKSGEVGRAKLDFRAAGPNVETVTFPLFTPVRIQLRRTDATTCWETRFTVGSGSDSYEAVQR